MLLSPLNVIITLTMVHNIQEEETKTLREVVYYELCCIVYGQNSATDAVQCIS